MDEGLHQQILGGWQVYECELPQQCEGNDRLEVVLDTLSLILNMHFKQTYGDKLDFVLYDKV